MLKVNQKKKKKGERRGGEMVMQGPSFISGRAVVIAYLWEGGGGVPSYQDSFGDSERTCNNGEKRVLYCM